MIQRLFICSDYCQQRKAVSKCRVLEAAVRKVLALEPLCAWDWPSGLLSPAHKYLKHALSCVDTNSLITSQGRVANTSLNKISVHSNECFFINLAVSFPLLPSELKHGSVLSCLPAALAMGLCVAMIAFVRLPSLKVSCLLLSGLLIYDVFWVRHTSTTVHKRSHVAHTHLLAKSTISSGSRAAIG